jgi:hypothetical protein
MPCQLVVAGPQRLFVAVRGAFASGQLAPQQLSRAQAFREPTGVDTGACQKGDRKQDILYSRQYTNLPVPGKLQSLRSSCEQAATARNDTENAQSNKEQTK